MKIVASVAIRSTVLKNLRSRLKLFLRLYDSQDLHLKNPLQLNDLYQIARVWTEDPNEVLREFGLDCSGTHSSEYERASEEISHRCLALDLPYPAYFNVASRTEELLFKIVRTLKPRIVVETGIANGRSSAIVLAAMELNAQGQLHSVDMNPDVGVLVADTQNRWSVHIGDGSTAFLENVLMRLEPIDLFIHDSDHGYECQYSEYELAERYGSPSCLIASDDVNWSYAFFDFCQSRSTSPVVLSDLNKFFGVTRRNSLAATAGSNGQPSNFQ